MALFSRLGIYFSSQVAEKCFKTSHTNLCFRTGKVANADDRLQPCRLGTPNGIEQRVAQVRLTRANRHNPDVGSHGVRMSRLAAVSVMMTGVRAARGGSGYASNGGWLQRAI